MALTTTTTAKCDFSSSLNGIKEKLVKSGSSKESKCHVETKKYFLISFFLSYRKTKESIISIFVFLRTQSWLWKTPKLKMKMKINPQKQHLLFSSLLLGLYLKPIALNYFRSDFQFSLLSENGIHKTWGEIQFEKYSIDFYLLFFILTFFETLTMKTLIIVIVKHYMYNTKVNCKYNF